MSLLFFILHLPHQRHWLLPKTVHRALSPARSGLLSGKLESLLRLLRAPQTRIYSGPVKNCRWHWGCWAFGFICSVSKVFMNFPDLHLFKCSQSSSPCLNYTGALPAWGALRHSSGGAQHCSCAQVSATIIQFRLTYLLSICAEPGIILGAGITGKTVTARNLKELKI